jgi:hypothetical protein
MKNLNASFVRSYKSKAGNTVFVYSVSGSEDSLAKYAAIQGDNLRKDDTTGKPLFFTTRYFGDNAKLLITTNDRVVADMSEFDKASSLASQYGGNLGRELASHAAAKLMGGTTAPAEVAAPVADASGVGGM